MGIINECPINADFIKSPITPPSLFSCYFLSLRWGGRKNDRAGDLNYPAFVAWKVPRRLWESVVLFVNV